jgi:hypothetical protein
LSALYQLHGANQASSLNLVTIAGVASGAAESPIHRKFCASWRLEAMASVHDARISSQAGYPPPSGDIARGEKFWLHEPELLAAHEATIADAVDVGPWYGPVDEAMQRLVEEGSGDPISFSQLRVKRGGWPNSDRSISGISA